MRKIFWAIGLIFLLMPVCGHAESKVTPERLEGVAVVDADTVKKWLDSGEEMLLLDARKPNDFEAGHIPGAELHTVPGDLDVSDEAIVKSVAALEQFADLKDLAKDFKIVVYCNGYT